MQRRPAAPFGLTALGGPELHPELQRLAAMAQRLLGADFCAINLMDEELQWCVAGSPGVPLSVVTRSVSLSERILARSTGSDVFVTEDASKDPDLAASEWVNGVRAATRFYSAAPLIDCDGNLIGTVCVWSTRPGTVTETQLDSLRHTRDAVMAVLNARRRTPELRAGIDDLVAAPADMAGEQWQFGPPRDSAAWSIEAVIGDRAIRTLFQPVVHLESGAVVGFEALTRGPVGSSLESPMALLDAARAAGCLGALDWLCRTHALQAAAAANLHPSLSWLINVEPAGLAIDCPSHLLAPLTRAKNGLRVILEIVERDLEGNVTALLRATDQARRDAWGVALDDVGAEESSLALLPFLRPDVVKLDMSLVRGVPLAAAAAITSAVRCYAEQRGAVILAEGIETAEQEQLARVFGASYGQGFLYGRPGALPESVPAPRHVIPLLQRLAPLAGGTPFEVLAATVEPQRALKRSLLHISRHLESCSHQWDQASVLLASFQRSEFFTPRKRRLFAELSETNALTAVLADGLDTAIEQRLHIAPLSAGSRMRQEWVVIVINPHYAAAFVARDCGDTGPDGDRQFDYIYTHNREAVILAARSFLQELPAAGACDLAGGQVEAG